MKKIFKRISAAVIALAVVLTAVVFDVPGKIIAAAATCPGHGSMKPWNKTDSLPSEGNYYLNCDVTVPIIRQLGGNLTLCLNGHTITCSNNGAYSVLENITLTLYDCNGNGKIKGASVDNQYAVVYIPNGTFNMYGGNITGNSIIGVRGGGVFNMHGGSISNNKDTGVSFYGTFNMYGGTISNNTAKDNGGGVECTDGGTFTMSGGTISNNNAPKSGGGVYAGSSANFVMSGGAITGNTANNGGGLYHIAKSITFNGNVNISGNKSGSNNNNICLGYRKTITVGSGFKPTSPIGVYFLSGLDCSAPETVTSNVSQPICSPISRTSRAANIL